LRAERQLCKEPNGPVITALSQYVAEQFQRHYDVSDERIVVIPNGVRVHKQVDAKDAERLRTHVLTQLRLKEADEPVFFLFAAHNFRLKGLAAGIKAIKQAAAHSNTQRQGYLIVAGNGKIRKYQRLAKKLGAHRKILFLGAVRHIQSVLSVVDVAMLPTFYDPCSRFILEALSAGKPVITTRFNGATDLFVDKRHGRVVDSPGNTGALAEAIGYFSDTNNIQKASQAIIADNIRENISISRVAKQLESLYESILQKKGRY